MQDGWDWAARWYLDGTLILDHNGRWQGGERRDNAWVSLFSKQALPSGQYRLDLLVKGTQVQTGICTIGAGARPAPTPLPRDGVEIRGRITNADSGQGIPGGHRHCSPAFPSRISSFLQLSRIDLQESVGNTFRLLL